MNVSKSAAHILPQLKQARAKMHNLEGLNQFELPYLSLLPKFYNMRGDFYQNFTDLNPDYPEQRLQRSLDTAMKKRFDFEVRARDHMLER